jgi:hypothetical protein
MKQLRIVGLTALTFVLSGCMAPVVAPTSSPIDCESSFERAIDWRAVDSLGEEGVKQWVTKTYGTAADSSALVDGSTVFRWKAAQKAYTLTFLKHPVRIDVEWQGQSPTVGDMIRCLGAPDSYQASVVPSPAGSSTGLYLWYVDLGVVGWRTGSAGDKMVTQNTPLEGLYLVHPSTEATMMTKIHPEGSWPPDRLTSSLKTWSGIDGIVFSDYTK